jgi:uncharacterized phage protein (TIGR01671 family)
MIPKFRIYCYETQEMIVARDYRELAELFAGLDADGSIYSEPMQSTGLLDEKGNDVFEGDVVGITWYNGYNDLVGYRRLGGRVVYRKGSFCIEYPGDVEKGYSPTILDFAINVEIIGDIFENPELMEVEDDTKV